MKYKILIIALFIFSSFALGKIDMKHWEQIPEEDLALTDNPSEPGAGAMILFRHAEYVGGYYREHGAIKIFNNAGKDLANVELPDKIKKIKARTVKPDGTFVEITKDDIMKKIVVKKRRKKKKSKVFAFPDVEVGSILEYKFSKLLSKDDRIVFGWPFQTDLFCREAWIEFKSKELRIYNHFVMDVYLQASVSIEHNNGRTRYMGRDIPGRSKEAFLPPGREDAVYFFMYLAYQDIKGARSLDLSTREGKARYVDLFWEQYAVRATKELQKFMKSKKALRNLNLKIVNGDQRDIGVATKIYDYVARNFRNTDYETKSEEERSKESNRDKQKKIKSINDVIKNGYGSSEQLTLLYVALLRSSGIHAFPAYACGRDDGLFNKEILFDQYDEPLVAIGETGNYFFLDLSVPYCPFGEISWYKQGVPGVVFTSEGGDFITTPCLKPETNTTERKVDVYFDGRGLKCSFSLIRKGNPDFWTKNIWDDESEEERRDYVKTYLEKNFPDVQLISYAFNNLRDPGKNLVIEGEFSTSDYLVQTRSRQIFKPSLLGKNQNTYFTNETRKFPVFFDYALVVKDEIIFHLPEGYSCDQMPNPFTFKNFVGRYSLTFEKGDGILICRRFFRINGYYFTRSKYGRIKKYFDMVRRGDDTNVVLKLEE